MEIENLNVKIFKYNLNAIRKISIFLMTKFSKYNLILIFHVKDYINSILLLIL